MAHGWIAPSKKPLCFTALPHPLSGACAADVQKVDEEVLTLGVSPRSGTGKTPWFVSHRETDPPGNDPLQEFGGDIDQSTQPRPGDLPIKNPPAPKVLRPA